jgi:hypothetical protein
MRDVESFIETQRRVRRLLSMAAPTVREALPMPRRRRFQ